MTLGLSLFASSPQPLEHKKLKSWMIVAVGIIVTALVLGIVGGLWWMGQVQQSAYTRVKVLSDDFAILKFGEEPNVDTYFFYFKSMGHYDGNGIWIGEYNPQTPITVDVFGSSDSNLAPTIGKVYDVLGIEIVVSEVYDDYVILLVKYE